MEEHLWEKAKLNRSCSHFGDDERGGVVWRFLGKERSKWRQVRKKGG
jgi:hypothetical protein